MRRTALGFLIGVAGLQQLAELPTAAVWWWGAVLLLPVMTRFARLRFPLAMVAGFLWAAFVAQTLLDGALDPRLEGQDVLVTGIIASLPERRDRGVRFQLAPERLHWQGIEQAVPGRLLLNWYGAAPLLRVGERWQLQVRLKRPHGFMNPGGFDYEAWLFRQGIRAKGYVRTPKGVPAPNRRLAATDTYPVERLRQTLRERLNATLSTQPLRGILIALAIGDRQQITSRHWEVLTRTGTSHLVAISGLHVGLVAGFAFFAVRRLWRLSARAVLWWPAAKAGALAGLLAAVVYAMLAGFSVPTQRALIMIAVVMLATILQYRTRPSNLLALALLLVLILDPMAVLAAGFWLSFGAVAVILYGMSGRLGGGSRWRRWWWQWGRVQWLVALGLLPLLVLLFGQASLVAPLANLAAVPWVSLLTVPLTLAGTLVLWLWPGLGEVLLGLAGWSVEILWWWLEALGDWRFAHWRLPSSPVWAVVAAVVGVVWLLAPQGLPARWVGGIWLLPLVLVRPDGIPLGEAHFALLDVGQGLAAVVRTQEHVLVFDAGPRFASGFNSGEAVVAPYLHAYGARHIDLLMVSHADNDHRGGVEGLVAQVPVQRIVSSAPERLAPLSAGPCRAGMRWEWDGVQFEILHPDATMPRSGRQANNRSCVLRVQAGGGSVLLSGDIEQAAEQVLVARGAALAADVLVVPHHGSRTSSSEAFLTAVAPRFALFPVGYRNRYGFPKPDVVARYRRREVGLFDTAHHGAIEIRLGGEDGIGRIETYRQRAARYWHHRAEPVSSDTTRSLLQ
jgi:competence protein ComEC